VAILVPGHAQQAYEDSQAEFEGEGLTAFPPTPFSSANAVGLLTERAEELGVESISDLEGQSENLTLYGSPSAASGSTASSDPRTTTGSSSRSSPPVDIGLRYEVLDKGDADLSILFATDAQLSESDKCTILEDDQGVLPAGNVLFVARTETVDEAGPDFSEVVESVQENLSLEVIQELNARVDLDKEDSVEAAEAYLREFGTSSSAPARREPSQGPADPGPSGVPT
jgi:osmoprotectant transport system substrate-binding protein